MNPWQIGNYACHLVDMKLSKIGAEFDLFVDIHFLVSKKYDTTLSD
jgi:hypothetical protein